MVVVLRIKRIKDQASILSVSPTLFAFGMSRIKISFRRTSVLTHVCRVFLKIGHASFVQIIPSFDTTEPDKLKFSDK